MKSLLILIILCIHPWWFRAQIQSPPHYQMLTQLSKNPLSPADTLRFPWNEYSPAALTYSLWQTHYLVPRDVTNFYDRYTYPANSSAQTQAELKYLLNLQSSRSDQDIKHAVELANIGFWPQLDLNPAGSEYQKNQTDLFYFGRAIFGEKCQAVYFPQLSKLLKNVMQDVRAVEFKLKYAYRRPRPYHLEPALIPLQKMGSPAFPSGHTLWAFVLAQMWSNFIPAENQRLLLMAEEIRWSRELMGIHFPSDNETSRLIAAEMLNLLTQRANFTADLKAAREEWEQKSFLFRPTR